MANLAAADSAEFSRAMVEAYAVNDRMNQLVLEHLDPRVWRAKPFGAKGRTIAAIFSHVHNVRRKWVRLSAPHLKLPAPLDRTRCTPKQAQAALRESAALCCAMLADALENPRSSIGQFCRDGWARPWTPGASMFAFMVSHDAHHRGQVCLLARELGYPLPQKINYGIWTWEKLSKECGFRGPR